MSSARSKTAVPYTESLRKRRVRKAGLVCFILYMGVLVYFLFFADWYEHGPGTHFAAGVNLVPFREIRRYIGMLRGGRSLKPFLNLVGNVVGFIPFGFFLPVMTRTFHSFIRVLLMGFLFSLGVLFVAVIPVRAGALGSGRGVSGREALFCPRLGEELFR